MSASAVDVVLSAGETSGDLQGALLAQALLRRNPSLRLAGLGGPRMRQAGVELWDDVTGAAVIGPVDLVRLYWRMRKTYQLLLRRILESRPKRLVLIDFPGFNLPLAEACHRQGIPTTYYIAPQIWAWGQGRLRRMHHAIDYTLCLFEFEKQFFEQHGVAATWIGHPLVDIAAQAVDLAQTRSHWNLKVGQPVIGLLPGSRSGEARRHVPILIAAAEHLYRRLGGGQFLLSRAPHLPDALFSAATGSSVPIAVEDQQYHALIAASDVVLVCSGTATLDVTLQRKPMVVIYKTHWLMAQFVRRAIRVPHVGMVNVLAGKEIVPERLQENCTPEKLADAALSLLQDATRRQKMIEELDRVVEILGPPGAVIRGAEHILNSL